MATRMNPLAGRYFNDPNMATAMSNLAAAFAPPSADEALGWSKLRGQNTQNQALADFIASGAGDQDVLGIGAGLFDWRGARETQLRDDATRRYGYDTTAATSRLNNAADNETRLRSDVLGYAGNPTGRAGLSAEELAAITGLDMPGFDPRGPVAPSETQVLGANRQNFIDQDEELARALAFDGIDASNVVTAEGTRMMPTGLAAVTGAEPFINRGAEAAPRPVILFDPQTSQQIGGFAVDGQYVLGDGTPAPAHLVPQALPQATGTAEDISLQGSTLGRAQRTMMDIDMAIDTASRLQALIAQAPASGGLVGTIRGTMQDLVATGGELSQLASSLQNQTLVDLEAGLFDEGAAAAIRQQAFDPNIPARQALTLLLATQYAKTLSPDRVSNELLGRILSSLGEGSFLANQQRTDAALQAIITDLQSRRGIAAKYSDGNGPAAAPGAAPPPAAAGPAPAPAAAGPAPGTIEPDAEGRRWQFIGGDPADPGSWRQVQ